MCRNTWIMCVAATALVGLSAGAARATDEAGEIAKAVRGAKLSLVQAVDAARRHAEGGMLVEAELEPDEGAPTYDIEFVVGDSIKEIEIDAVSGEVEEEETEPLSERGEAAVAKLRPLVAVAKVNWAEAVGLAKGKVNGGTPYEIELELEDDALRYEIGLLADGKLIEVEIDAAAGEVLEIEEEDADDDSDEHGVDTQGFDDIAVGTVPQGWKVEGTRQHGPLATWQVVADVSAPSEPNVLALSRINHDSRGTFNLCWTDQIQFRDGEIELRFKAISGEEDQGGGPIWRVRDKNNYYICRANPLEDNFRLYYVKDGRRRQIASARVKIPGGVWHTITIEHEGNQIACYLNGEELLTATDDTFPDAGGLGFWTKADAVTSFDDLMIEGSGDHDDDDGD